MPKENARYYFKAYKGGKCFYLQVERKNKKELLEKFDEWRPKKNAE